MPPCSAGPSLSRRRQEAGHRQEVALSKYLILGLVIMAGTLQPVQVAANTKFREAVDSPVMAGLLSFLVGVAALLVLEVFGVPGGRGRLWGAAGAPWWAWAGGLSGVLSVVVAILALPRSNAATVIAMTILGQLTASVVIDHFGWLNVPQVSVSFRRILGCLLLVAGAFLIQKK